MSFYQSGQSRGAGSNMKIQYEQPIASIPEPMFVDNNRRLTSQTSIKNYDYFQPTSKQNIMVSSYFPETKYQDGPTTCPVCWKGVSYFRLPTDPTTTVFCSTCKQPFHHCPLHRTPLQGMGVSLDDPLVNKCQCEVTQGFLGMDHWNSCFNK